MADININGVIVPTDDAWIYQWFGYQYVCPKDIENALAKVADGEQVDVWINSDGGSVAEGSEIYTRLRAFTRGKVAIHITGRACSAASLIACAGYCEMSPGTQMMIHNVSCCGSGDKNAHQFIAELLNTADESIANIYMLKSGKSRDEVLQMMNAETWLSPQKALEHKLIDKIMFDEHNVLGGVQIAASASGSGLLPPEVIQKCKNEREKMLAGQTEQGQKQNAGNTPALSDIDIRKQQAEARLKFLGLSRGEFLS